MGLEITPTAIYGFSLGRLSQDQLNDRLEKHNFTLDEDLPPNSGLTLLSINEKLPETKGIQLFNTAWGQEESSEETKWYIGFDVTYWNALPDKDTTFEEIKALLEKVGLFDENKHNKSQLLVYASATIY